MALTRQDVQARLKEGAERLEKLSGDFLHIAEQSSVESLKALKGLRKRAEEGKLSYLQASEMAAGMATAMQENLDVIEAGQSSFDLVAHQNEYDRMIESLLMMRGQARRTAQALGRHITRMQGEQEALPAVEAKG